MTKDKSETGYCTMQDTCVWKRKSEHVQVYSYPDSLASFCVMCNGERAFYHLSHELYGSQLISASIYIMVRVSRMRNKHNVQIKTKT